MYLDKDFEQKERRLRFGSDVFEAVLEDVRYGVPLEMAAISNGISYSHLKKVIQTGKKEMHENVLSLWANFVRELYRVEKVLLLEHLNDITDSQRGHAGKQWMLERRFWRYYSSKVETFEMAEEIEAIKQMLKKGQADNEKDKESYKED